MMQNIWIFQLVRVMTEEQEARLMAGMQAFLKDWAAHGTPVPGRVEVRHRRFLVVQAEPGSTSGCSIDSMTQAVDAQLDQLGLSLLPNGEICYLNSQGEIASINFRELKGAVEKGQLTGETTVFDASLAQTNDLSRWEVPLSTTWMARFLPKQAV